MHASIYLSVCLSLSLSLCSHLSSTTTPSQSLRKPVGLHSHAVAFKVLHSRYFNAIFLHASVKKFDLIFQSKVWFKVWKVISRMAEENEQYRNRLLAYSQLNGEGRQ